MSARRTQTEDLARAVRTTGKGHDLQVQDAAAPILGDILRRARTHRHLTLRDVERRTGIPNAHLSQIERGQIKHPDPKILWDLCELYLLNYARLAEWSGYSEKGTSGDSAVIALALRLLSKLELKDQQEVLRYLDALERRSRPPER